VTGYKPQIGQIGNQLQSTFNLFDGAVLNPDAALVSEYERMLDTDETVSAAFYFLTFCVLHHLGEYTHPDDKITKYIHKCFEKIDGSLLLACEDILSAVWAGYSVTEIVWTINDSSGIRPAYLAAYHPSSIYFKVDDYGRLKKIEQINIDNAMGIDLPKEKCITFSYGKRFGNYYGKSAFKPIRKNWLLKDAILKMWASALDKFGTPLMVAIVPDGSIIDPETKQEMSQLEYAIKLLDNLQHGTALALAAGGSRGPTVGVQQQIPDIKALVTGGSGVGSAFSLAMSYFNKMICRGLLIPSLLFDEGARSGSLALGTSHFYSFMFMVKAIYRQLKEVLLDQLIARIIEYNFGLQNDYGDFAEQPPGPEELDIWSKIFDGLTQSGAMDMDAEEDFKYAREKIGLPLRAVAKNDLQVKTESALAQYDHYLRAKEEGK
jgi:hypothetical protein